MRSMPTALNFVKVDRARVQVTGPALCAGKNIVLVRFRQKA
jgi:hypothetical protein